MNSPLLSLFTQRPGKKEFSEGRKLTQDSRLNLDDKTIRNKLRELHGEGSVDRLEGKRGRFYVYRSIPEKVAGYGGQPGSFSVKREGGGGDKTQTVPSAPKSVPGHSRDSVTEDSRKNGGKKGSPRMRKSWRASGSLHDYDDGWADESKGRK